MNFITIIIRFLYANFQNQTIYIYQSQTYYIETKPYDKISHDQIKLFGYGYGYDYYNGYDYDNGYGYMVIVMVMVIWLLLWLWLWL